MNYEEIVKVWREDKKIDMLENFFNDFTYNSISLSKKEIKCIRQTKINYKTRSKSLKDILEQK